MQASYIAHNSIVSAQTRRTPTILAAEAKVKDQFEGNVVDLGVFQFIFLVFDSSNEITFYSGSKYSPQKSLQSCSIPLVVV